MRTVLHGCFYSFRVLFVEVRTLKSLLFGVLMLGLLIFGNSRIIGAIAVVLTTFNQQSNLSVGFS